MSLKEQYQKIDALKAQLDKLQPLKPENEQRLWRKFRLDWNYNSNHMEGNTLTYGHTELLLFFDKVVADYSGREIEEMKAHDVAIKMVVELAKEKERDLTENFIRQLNETILVRPFWKEAITPDGQPTRRQIIPGEYKKFPNSVRLENGEIFHYASPEETPALMNELIQFYRLNSAKTEVHPLWLAAMLHYKFVRIHPFDDSNGRTARLIMNYVFLKKNFPPCIIKDSDKKNYITALNKADIGDLESFILYIGEQLSWSFQKSIDAALGKNIDEPDDLDKEITILKRELKERNVLTQKGNSENIAFVIEENLIPLFILLEKQFSKFHEFFFDYERRITFMLDDQLERVLGNGTWETLIQNWLFNQVKNQQKEVRYFKYQYIFKGLKNSVHAEDFWIVIETWFNDYNYKIQTEKNRNNLIPFPYGKKLSEEELRDIFAPLIQDLISRIRDRTIKK